MNDMKTCKTNGTDGAQQEPKQEVSADCVDGAALRKREDPETEGLLKSAPAESTDYGNGRQDGINCTGALPNGPQIPMVKTKKNATVCPLWVFILLIFILITGVIFLSLYLCKIVYEDPDEKYDPALFDAQQNFSGSFGLPNLNLTKELSLNSNDTAELQSKLEHLYRSSPALGRYFSYSQVDQISNGPPTARFQLMFVLPSEERHQLTHFTLSREVVFNVLRQFLYDQVDTSDHMYIEPTSVKMWE